MAQDDDLMPKEVYGKEAPYIMLARIEERIKSLHQVVQRDREEALRLNVELRENIVRTISEYKKETDKHIEDVKDEMVKQSEFEPVKRIVYGVVGFLMLGVGGLIMSFITKGLLLTPLVGGPH